MLHREVREIMTKSPSYATPEMKIGELIEKMLNEGMNQLPVVENGQFLGMITTYDLWRNTNGAQDHEVLVKEVMNTKVIKISPKDKLGTAAELFMDRRFKTLPVVNLRNELKGVITAFDIIKTTLKDEYTRPILYKEVLEA